MTSRERDAQLRRQAVVLGDSDDGEEDAAGARGEGTGDQVIRKDPAGRGTEKSAGTAKKQRV